MRGVCIIHKDGEERKDHKYVKREKIKGKWRYWYKDLTKNVANKINEVKDVLGFDEREALTKSQKKLDENLEKYDKNRKNYLDTSVKIKYDNKNQDVRDEYYKSYKNYAKSKNSVNISTTEVKHFVDAYSKTPLGKIENTIQKGAKFVQDILGITKKKEIEKEKKDYEEKEERKQLEETERKKKEKEEYDKKEEVRSKQEQRQRTERIEDFNDLSVKQEKLSAEEDMTAVNPFYYQKNQLNYQTNSYSCSAAYDLRRRGYDVEAIADFYKDGATMSEIVSWYDVSEKDVKKVIVNEKNANRVTYGIENELRQYNDGARGILVTYWKLGGAHSSIWEVNNGEVLIRDCQNNTTVSVYDYIKASKSIRYFRTDNVNVNNNILGVVRNKSNNFVENNNLNKISGETENNTKTEVKKDDKDDVKSLLDFIRYEIKRNEQKIR